MSTSLQTTRAAEAHLAEEQSCVEEADNKRSKISNTEYEFENKQYMQIKTYH
jgi:hypothetical protein